MPFASSLPSLPSTGLPLLFGAALHLARGFGAAPSNSGGKGFGKQQKPQPSPIEPDAEHVAPSRAAKGLRGKIIPCSACSGTGKKPCQFCQGTKLMVGFLGRRVPCVPCQGKATLGRPCVECGGMGYFTP